VPLTRNAPRQTKYLKVENEVLRRKLPGRITITPKGARATGKLVLNLGRSRDRLAINVRTSTRLDPAEVWPQASSCSKRGGGRFSQSIVGGLERAVGNFKSGTVGFALSKNTHTIVRVFLGAIKTAAYKGPNRTRNS
jgi:hypothetical protein